MSPEYKAGFDSGYKFSVNHFDPMTGRYNKDFPDGFEHRTGVFNCGFGEGLISGRSSVIDKRFGKIKNIFWFNGKPVITR